jgi:hypothetical protein
LSDTTNVTRRSLREWLADQWTRFEVWRFMRASVEVNVRQACGHRTNIRLLRKGIEYRLAAYESSTCAECTFYRCMAELRARRGGRG